MNSPVPQPSIDHRFRPLGVLLALASFLAYAWFVFQGLSTGGGHSLENVVNLLVFRDQPEVASRWIRSLFLIGVLLVILTREQREDEWIQQTRMKSLSDTLVLSMVSILGYTIVGPVTTERLVSVNVWLNLTAVIYLVIFGLNLRRAAVEPAS